MNALCSLIVCFVGPLTRRLATAAFFPARGLLPETELLVELAADAFGTLFLRADGFVLPDRLFSLLLVPDASPDAATADALLACFLDSLAAPAPAGGNSAAITRTPIAIRICFQPLKVSSLRNYLLFHSKLPGFSAAWSTSSRTTAGTLHPYPLDAVLLPKALLHSPCPFTLIISVRDALPPAKPAARR